MLDWKLTVRFLLVSIVCLMWCVSCDTDTADQDKSLPEISYSTELQGAIDRVLAKYPEYQLGLSAAVLKPGCRIWTGVSGYSNEDEPVTEEMLFNVGSVLKNFEAALVLKLVEEGELSLDDRISDFLPSYRNVDGEITIRQLLNHTSGVFNVFEHPDFPWARTDVDYAKEWAIDEVFDSFVLEPYGPPGYAQHYSSTNYLLLTAIIEKVTGSTVPEEIERCFLEPIKLDDTYVTEGEPPGEEYSTAHAWVDIDRDGKLDDLHGIPVTWISSLSHPTMYSTPRDLVRWMYALYDDGAVLSSDSMKEMLTFPETELRDPDGLTLGLGVADYSAILELPVLGHGGSALGYSAAALYLPDYGISVAWLINTGESPHDLASSLMSRTWSELRDVIEAAEP